MCAGSAVAFAALQLLACGAAPKTTALDAIRARGVVRCASHARPGLATQDADGRWSGLEIEICRAIATAVFGAEARYAFHSYASPRDVEGLRRGEDDVAFLTAPELADAMPGTRATGPTIFVETHDLLVSVDSPVQRAADLAGRSVCFIAASPANDSLDAWSASRNIPLIRYAFREDDEMYDTYAVQRCQAVVGEATALAQSRLGGGVNHLRSRFLSDHLAMLPIIATTGADPAWAAIVGTIVQTLVASERGAEARPAGGDGLGLVADWRKTVLDRVGDYGAIFRRTLGADSPLKLDRGLNQRP